MKQEIFISLIVVCFILTPAVSWGFLSSGFQSQESVLSQGNVGVDNVQELSTSEFFEDVPEDSEDPNIGSEIDLSIPQINRLLNILQEKKKNNLVEPIIELMESCDIKYNSINTKEGVKYEISEVPESVDIKLEYGMSYMGESLYLIIAKKENIEMSKTGDKTEITSYDLVTKGISINELDDKEIGEIKGVKENIIPNEFPTYGSHPGDFYNVK